MVPTKKRPSIEEGAQIMADLLMSNLSSKNWERNPRLWEPIFALVCKEGDGAREAGPFSVLTYQRYVAIAALHLGKFPDMALREGLVTRIENDMKVLAHHLRNMEAHLFTDEESELMGTAVQKIFETHKALTRE